jgi:hypothetical protein
VASADEAADVHLPATGTGDLSVTFTSSARELSLDVNDLSEFELGVGKLETGPIPIGEFISLEATLGSQTPITLTKPKLTLLPVIGTITAAETARARKNDAAQSSIKSAVGTYAAVWGGIAGGLLGSTAGQPKPGAEAGGQFLGSQWASLVDFFGGDRAYPVAYAVSSCPAEAPPFGGAQQQRLVPVAGRGSHPTASGSADLHSRSPAHRPAGRAAESRVAEV